MKLYRDIFQQAWHHTIQRPRLWIFGFFATFVFGASGELDRYLRFMSAIVSDGHLLNAKSWLDGRWLTVATGFYTTLQSGNVNAWLLCIGMVLAAIVVTVMMSVSVGALIHGIAHQSETFSVAFNAGLKHWIQLFWLFVSAYVFVMVITFALVTGVTTLAPVEQFESSQLLLTIIAGIVFVPLVVIVSFLVRLAALSIVLDQTHLGQALQRAWKLFAEHWLVVLEMAIVSFIVVGVASVAVLLGLTIIFLPYFVGLSFGTADAAVISLENTLFIGQGIYLLLSLFTGAVLTTWQWSAWTLLFQTLHDSKPASTLVRWIGSVK